MPGAHRRKDDPPHTEFAHTRGIGEGDKVLAWGFKIEKYFRLAWPALTLLGGIFMATVWRPLRTIPELHATVDHIVEQQAIAAKFDSASMADRDDLRRSQMITNRILCFNLDRADRIKYDINCGDIPLPEVRQ